LTADRGVTYHRQVESRARRFTSLFIALALFGAAPSLVPLLWGGRGLDQRPWLEREAKLRAALFDLVAERWLGEVRARADDVSALLGQLPDAPIGRAAEGTIVLYLQRKLEKEMTEYAVIAPDGKVLLSTGRTRGVMPEVAQATRRPAAALVRAGSETQIVVAAPLARRGRFAGLLVGRPNATWLARQLGASEGPVEVNVVDANGVRLTDRLAEPEVSRLGSESGAGLTQVSGYTAAYAPLQTMRAVVVVAAAPAGADRWRWPLASAACALLLGALVAWALSRRDPR
jgi:hypothetical protein